jgi:hypothetical protein
MENTTDAEEVTLALVEEVDEEKEKYDNDEKTLARERSKLAFHLASFTPEPLTILAERHYVDADYFILSRAARKNRASLEKLLRDQFTVRYSVEEAQVRVKKENWPTPLKKSTLAIKRRAFPLSLYHRLPLPRLPHFLLFATIAYLFSILYRIIT